MNTRIVIPDYPATATHKIIPKLLEIQPNLIISHNVDSLWIYGSLGSRGKERVCEVIRQVLEEMPGLVAYEEKLIPMNNTDKVYSYPQRV